MTTWILIIDNPTDIGLKFYIIVDNLYVFTTILLLDNNMLKQLCKESEYSNVSYYIYCHFKI